MNKELLLLIDAISFEKSISKDIVLDALEAALAGASRRQFDEDVRVRVEIDAASGEYRAFRQWEIVDDDARIEEPARQIRLMDALEDAGEDAEVGSVLEEEIAPPELGRVAAQTVKQILVQRMREGERAQVRESWAGRMGEMVLAEVKRRSGNAWHLDLGGGAEALLPAKEQIPGENLRPGNRVRVVVQSIDPAARGPQIMASRAAPELLLALMAQEIPEVGEGAVEVKHCAREPGQRAKVAVVARDKRVDPIGACIGMRGSRVQTIATELNGERMDLVLWDENPATFIVNAMAPARVERMVVFENERRVDLGLAEDQVAKAIGRAGQNVRLASTLTGWKIRAMSLDALDAAELEADQAFADKLSDALEVDDEVAAVLVENGFTSVEEIAFCEIGELLSIDAFDEDIVDELRRRAEGVMQQEALEDEMLGSSGLLEIEGVDKAIGRALLNAEIADRDALADLAQDELAEMIGIDAARAGKIIMAARAHWFANE